MAESLEPATAATADRGPSASSSALLVVGFWWAATGLTFAMQASPRAGLLTVAATTAFALYGFALIVESRRETSPRAARRAFLGSSLVWWWCAAVFYAGWGIDASGAAPEQGRTLALALQAIRATWRPDALGVAALVLVACIVWRQPNRVALWALAVFWGTLQTAKLNVFFGVLNPGRELLPPHLAGLGVYFGPEHSSPLLPMTVAVLTLLTAIAGMRAMRATSPFVRHGSLMIGVLLALAVVEHAVLGVPFMLPLWDFFMAGGA